MCSQPRSARDGSAPFSRRSWRPSHGHSQRRGRVLRRRGYWRRGGNWRRRGNRRRGGNWRRGGNRRRRQLEAQRVDLRWGNSLQWGDYSILQWGDYSIRSPTRRLAHSHSRHVFPRLFVCVFSHLTHAFPPLVTARSSTYVAAAASVLLLPLFFCCRQLFRPRRFWYGRRVLSPPAGDSARAFGFQRAGRVDHCVGLCHRGNRRAEPIQCACRSGGSMRTPHTCSSRPMRFPACHATVCFHTHVPHLPHAVLRILIRRWSPTAGCATSSSRSSPISRGPLPPRESPRRASLMRSPLKSSLTGTLKKKTQKLFFSVSSQMSCRPLLPYVHMLFQKSKNTHFAAVSPTDGFMRVCRAFVHASSCLRSPPTLSMT